MDRPTSVFLTCVAISASSLLYTCIWLWPGCWRRATGSSPIRLMALAAHCLKVVQFLLLAHAFFFPLEGEDGTPTPYASLLAAARSGGSDFYARLAGSAAALCVGQLFNARVYHLLGERGVYYGNLLEPRVQLPWVTAWPFSWVAHPQYVGSCLSLLGACGATLMPRSVALCWGLNYAYLACMESDLLFPAREAPRSA